MINNYNGVKYLDRYDLASGYYLNRASKILDTFNIKNQYDDINTILEFHNICKYFEDDQRLSSWSDDIYNNYKNICISLRKTMGIFMSKISNDSLLILYDKVDVNYIEDFWELFEQHCLKKEYTSAVINKIIANSIFTLRCILLHKKIVPKLQYQVAHFSYLNCNIKLHIFPNQIA